MPVTGKTADGKGGGDHTTMEYPAMVFNHPGPIGGLLHLLPARTDLVVLPTDQEFIMNQGVLELIAWPISRNPLYHKEFLQRL